MRVALHLTDDVAETMRRWADHARARGLAAVLEAAYVAGMAERVLAWRGGERRFYAMPFEQRYIWGATAGIIRNMHQRLLGS